MLNIAKISPHFLIISSGSNHETSLAGAAPAIEDYSWIICKINIDYILSLFAQKRSALI